jgi:ribosomal protein S18 acetylase RimI-like enzyme
MDIRTIGAGNVAAVMAASPLFDGPAAARIAQRFLDSEGHFLLVAYEDGGPAGFVSGIEMTHPDKGTEMFLYELAVGEAFRGRGIGTALVTALRDLAVEHGCYDMWVLTDADNTAALATYEGAGADEKSSHVMLTWNFRPEVDLT